MTDTDTEMTEGQERSSRAAEYALGLLEGNDLRLFEAELSQSALLRSEVVRWQEHFAAMGMEVEEVVPPSSALGHIKRELWGENRLPWRRRIRLWEFALGGVAAALVAYAVYNSSGYLGWTGDHLQAQMTSETYDLQLVAALDPATGLLRLERSGMEPDAGRAFELWAIAENAAPVSLGVLPAQPVTALRLSEAQAGLILVGTVLAVSDEPDGGSPTGAPTGAVLAAGPVQALTNL